MANACAAAADGAAARSSRDVEGGIETLKEDERVQALQAELDAAHAEITAMNQRSHGLQQVRAAQTRPNTAAISAIEVFIVALERVRL